MLEGLLCAVIALSLGLTTNGSVNTIYHSLYSTPIYNEFPNYRTGKVSNHTIAGYENHCHKTTEYFVNNNVQFQMCIAHNPDYLNNGNSITNLIMVRGFMPTCRVLHLLYWMLATTSSTSSTSGASHSMGFTGSVPSPSHPLYHRDATFVDVGANIGSCSLHFAALGNSVIAIEPLLDHVSIIMGSLQYNPAFNVELYHGIISTSTRSIKAKVVSQEHNWGNTTVEEIAPSSSSSSAESGDKLLLLHQFSLDHLLQRRKVAVLKLDCEGCEYEALVGARKVLYKIPIIKLELINPTLKNGTSTVTAKQTLEFLLDYNYDLYFDHWNENPYYNGRMKHVLTNIDQLFGSRRFRFTSNLNLLDEAARKILSNPINVRTFDFIKFIEVANDVIAIKREVSARMKEYWKIST